MIGQARYGRIRGIGATARQVGGLLWTTTNSASIRIDRFAKMYKKGLGVAGCEDAKLERIAPMTVDFLVRSRLRI